MLVSLLNGLIEAFTFILNIIVVLLPTTPFQFEQLQWGSFGQLIGYIFPIANMAIHMVALLSAVLLYYAVRQMMRLIKMVQ